MPTQHETEGLVETFIREELRRQVAIDTMNELFGVQTFAPDECVPTPGDQEAAHGSEEEGVKKVKGGGN